MRLTGSFLHILLATYVPALSLFLIPGAIYLPFSHCAWMVKFLHPYIALSFATFLVHFSHNTLAH